jgi:uncharacterized protein (TIGR02302 family)
MILVPTPERRLARQMLLSRLALGWERLWPALWPALAVLCAFAVLALFDLPGLLPGWAHLALLGGFALAFAGSVVWGVRALAWPDRNAARRRIELTSGLGHRPLAALADRPSGTLDPAATGLWEAHRRRMAAAARQLRVGWPAASLAPRDPFGLRAILALLLVLAAIDAGADWRERLGRSLVPSLGNHVAGAAASFDIWITPPEYTGLAPQFLHGDTAALNAAAIPVATGSVLLAQIHGGRAVPRLAIDGAASDFAAIDSDNFRAQATLTKGKSIEVRQGGATLGRWPIEIVPDNPPVAAFAEPPSGTARAALKLDFRAGDDYGVEAVKAVIRRQDGDPKEAIEIPLPLPGLHLKEATGISYQDLSPHPWAGLPVEIRVVATDALGQTGESEAVRMNLPERVFNHPIARAIIDERKELVKDPTARAAVADALEDLNQRPALYRDDTVVYLALRTASLELRRGDPAASIAAVVPLLWDAALHIEDGNMSLAEREVRRLQQELQDALAKGAPDQEIDRLMRELRQALDQYMQALAQDAQRNPDQAGEPVDPSKIITPRDIQRMLDRAQELAKSGAQQQARELLSQLQDILENMKTARPGQSRQRGSSQAQQMMRGLRGLMQQQQQLLDRSFRAQRQQNPGSRMGQQGQQGQQQQPGDAQGNAQTGDEGQMGDMAEMGDAANQQEALRHMLGQIMQQLGEGLGDIPDPFGRADRAMRDATGALGRGQPGDAIAPQTQALDELQQAAREFAKELQQRAGNGWGDPGDDENGVTDRDARGNTDRDPFGRPMSSNGPFDQGDVAIPDASILQKSRQILDELRRRAGERFRPTLELDYIDRLLRRF